MHEGQDLGRRFGQSGVHPVRINGLAPFVLDRHDSGTRASGHVGHAPAEHAVDRHDAAVAGLQQVRHGCFHTRSARRRQRHAGVIRRVEHPL